MWLKGVVRDWLKLLLKFRFKFGFKPWPALRKNIASIARKRDKLTALDFKENDRLKNLLCATATFALQTSDSRELTPPNPSQIPSGPTPQRRGNVEFMTLRNMLD